MSTIISKNAGINVENGKTRLFVEFYKFNTSEQKTTKVKAPKAVSFINDCSYSMDDEINELKVATKYVYENVLNENDIVSGLSFASYNKEKDFITPTQIVDKIGQKAVIFNQIDKGLYTYGCTDYVSVLRRYIDKHYAFISQFYDNISEKTLFFFTDGWPNERPNTEIYETLRRLPKDVTVIYVGFGNCYNREVMANMQAITGGNILHVTDISKYKTEISKYVGEGISHNIYKTSDYNIENVLDTTNYITSFVFDDSNNILVQKDTETIQTLSNEFTYVRIFKVRQNSKHTPKIEKRADIDKELFYKIGSLSAYVLSKQVKTLFSLAVLNDLLRDVYITDMYKKAFTIDEITASEQLFLDVCKDSKLRFKDGEQKVAQSNLPDKFLVLRTLAEYYAKVKPIIADNYKGISLKGEYVDIHKYTKPVFEDTYSTISQSSVKYGNKSEKTLNITLNFTKKGTLSLKDDDTKRFNAFTLPVSESRSYTLVEFSEFGGAPLKAIKVDISQECLNALIAINVVPKNTKNTNFTLDISKYPLYKLQDDVEELDSKAFADTIYKIQENAIKLGYLNAIARVEEEDEEKVTKFGHTEEESSYLQETYAWKNGYMNYPKTYHATLEVNKQPTVEILENSDTEFANFYTFDFDLSSKAGKGGKMNSVQSFGGVTGTKWFETYKKAKDKGASTMTPTQIIAKDVDSVLLNNGTEYLPFYIAKLKKEQAILMDTKSSMLIANIFGKLPFSEQTSRTFVYDCDTYGLTCQISTRKKYYGKYEPKK